MFFFHFFKGDTGLSGSPGDRGKSNFTNRFLILKWLCKRPNAFCWTLVQFLWKTSAKSSLVFAKLFRVDISNTPDSGLS